MSHALGVRNTTERSCFFGDGKRDPCNLSDVQLAGQIIPLSFIYVSYHLSDDLKIRHKIMTLIKYTTL